MVYGTNITRVDLSFKSCDFCCCLMVIVKQLCTVNMARQISQQTFDAAVLENIDLLEMSPEDAVLEAVQQFEAQVLFSYQNITANN